MSNIMYICIFFSNFNFWLCKKKIEMLFFVKQL